MPKLKIAQELLDILYPIGCVYISTSSTNPSNLFGGQWTQISGRFLYCTTTSKTTGGSNTTGSHVLTIDEIPSHNHDNYVDNGWGTKDWGYMFNYSNKCALNGGASGYTGGGQGHTHEQNLPPWFSVYCWYRTS